MLLELTFQGNTWVKFYSNSASDNGGALYGRDNCTIKITETSTITTEPLVMEEQYTLTLTVLFFRVIFHHNEATQGGAIFAVSDTVFKGNSEVQFLNNKDDTSGGALFVSNTMFNGHTLVTFKDNKTALNGGAVHANSFTITMEQKSRVIFINNSAENEGAIFLTFSTLSLTEQSNVTFDSNTAGQSGGAIHFDEYTNAAFKNSIISQGSHYFTTK